MREDLKQANIVFISWKETNKMLDLFFGVMSMHFFLLKKNKSNMGISNTENILETKQERIEVLCRAVGTPMEKRGEIKKKLCEGEFEHYVLTYDNVLKMVAILLNIRSDLPVLHYIENKCIQFFISNTNISFCLEIFYYLACAADIKLEAVDIHGGIERTHIRELVEKCKTMLEQQSNDTDSNESKERENEHDAKEIWLFLDEFNTSPDIGWFNELICNHTLDGVAIPKEIKIIAACNPYRERKHNLQEKSWYHKDPLIKYVYRVFPLCQTVKAHLWQFGSLSELDERQYISEMTKDRKKELTHAQTIFDSEAHFIAEQIFRSQHFVRTNYRMWLWYP
ncbi:hypothetical protein RFI_25990 [Reticulomyxa filosa]|uniref:ATPase dynein-related AAA domain-containing protein n=1 Tax=Reticulomyxa filosa TaxID=46433 RepID=X6MBM6_RETFI|nr:hypothetical protein RFI_25990 [Reticulomyxa filosa]|eukprot:ETO11388.1 hypothetical protein RFI_25990 [Reticulomyxa filosa]